MDFSIDTAFDCPSALEQTKEEHKEVEIKPVKSDLAHKGMSRITSDPIISFSMSREWSERGVRWHGGQVIRGCKDLEVTSHVTYVMDDRSRLKVYGNPMAHHGRPSPVASCPFTLTFTSHVPYLRSKSVDGARDWHTMGTERGRTHGDCP